MSPLGAYPAHAPLVVDCSCRCRSRRGRAALGIAAPTFCEPARRDERHPGRDRALRAGRPSDHRRRRGGRRRAWHRAAHRRPLLGGQHHQDLRRDGRAAARRRAQTRPRRRRRATPARAAPRRPTDQAAESAEPHERDPGVHGPRALAEHRRAQSAGRDPGAPARRLRCRPTAQLRARQPGGLLEHELPRARGDRRAGHRPTARTAAARTHLPAARPSIDDL